MGKLSGATKSSGTVPPRIVMDAGVHMVFPMAHIAPGSEFPSLCDVERGP
jgi:hypothetical protein